MLRDSKGMLRDPKGMLRDFKGMLRDRRAQPPGFDKLSHREIHKLSLH